MPAETKTTTRIDRSKTYVCRFSCGFETTWPAALGRHEAARHNGHVPVTPSVPSVPGAGTGNPPGSRDRDGPGEDGPATRRVA